MFKKDISLYFSHSHDPAPKGGLNTKQKIRSMKNHLKLKHPIEWKKSSKEIRELCQK